MERSLIWKYLQSSVVGTSHMGRGLPCQDFSKTSVVVRRSGESCFVFAVADGAGSAKYSGEGARVSCEQIIKCAELILETDDRAVQDIEEGEVGAWLRQVRDVIKAKAEQQGEVVREFACTMLGGVVGETSSLFFQIGDGAIVYQIEGELKLPFWPEMGEIANETYFITEEDAISHLQLSKVVGDVTGVAAFTDGIQRLALNFTEKSPHKGFFNPMLSALESSSADESELLQRQLNEFLGGDQINSRTDDDKTLVIAIRKKFCS